MPEEASSGLDLEIPLVDHHVHSVVRQLSERPALERLLVESGDSPPPGYTHFDSFLGAAMLHACGPVLDLEDDASADEYVRRRFELGGEEVNRRLLNAAGVEEWLVDHGYRGGELVEVDEMADLSGNRVRRVVRLEQVAGQAAEEAAAGTGSAQFAEIFAALLEQALTSPDSAVGCKSILAYRHGLDVDPSEPSPAEVREAAGEWLSEGPGENGWRLSHPVLLRHLVWMALRRGLPLQFHTGYGDRDLDLHRSNPLLLTDLIRQAADLGTPVMLLHCYPFHREAAYLATLYPEVYFDIGFVVNFAGYRADQVLAEAIETAPFHTMLYSSDAFGLAELHYLGAVQFRRALSRALAPLATREKRSPEDLQRVAGMIGAGNAKRVYRLTA